MDIAIGMIVGSLISIFSIFLTMNHIINQDRKKDLSSHFDIEMKSSGRYVKGTIYLKKRRDKFHAPR